MIYDLLRIIAELLGAVDILFLSLSPALYARGSMDSADEPRNVDLVWVLGQLSTDSKLINDRR